MRVSFWLHTATNQLLDEQINSQTAKIQAQADEIAEAVSVQLTYAEFSCMAVWSLEKVLCIISNGRFVQSFFLENLNEVIVLIICFR